MPVGPIRAVFVPGRKCGTVLLWLLPEDLVDTVDAGRGMDQLRHNIEHRQDRILDLADQLEERGHHTEGDGTRTQLQAAPDEGQQITQAEAGGQDRPRDDRETGPFFHPSHQGILRPVEPVDHPLLTAQGTQHGIVLHPFLDLHLDAAFLVADLERHLAKRPGDDLAEGDGQRREHQQGPGQAAVHRVHQQEGPDELDQRDEHPGQHRGRRLSHHIDIFGQAGAHVAGMHVLVGIKAAVEKAAEGFQANAVGLFRVGRSGHIVVELAKDHPAQHRQDQPDDHPDNILLRAGADRDIDKSLAEPDHQQAEPHLRDTRQHPDEGIPPDSLHPPPYPPKILHDNHRF